MISAGKKPWSFWVIAGAVLIAVVVVIGMVINAIKDGLEKAAARKAADAAREAAIAKANEEAAKFEREAILRGQDPATARAEAERRRRAALPLDEQVEEFERTVQLADCQRCQQEQPYWGQDIAKPDSYWLDHTKRCLPIKRACNNRGIGFNTRPPGRISPPNDYTG